MNKQTQLALAIAEGVSVTAWASANGVPRRTAFSWAKDPLVRKTVETFRRRTMEEAKRRIAEHSAWAADGIVMLAKVGDSDSVRLDAFRTIRAEMTGRLGRRLEMTSRKKRGFSNPSATE